MKLLAWSGDLRIHAEDRARANARLATLDDVRQWAWERGYVLRACADSRCKCEQEPG